MPVSLAATRRVGFLPGLRGASPFLTDDELAALAARAVSLTLSELRASVTTDERDALAQMLALRLLARFGERDERGATRVRTDAANVTYAVQLTRGMVRSSREWRDVADTFRTAGERARDDAPLVTATDPAQMADPSTAPGLLAQAIQRNARDAAQRDPASVTDPGQMLAAVDTLTDALAGAAWTTPAQRRRVRLALAVALDERDAATATADHGAALGMTLRSATERAAEGRRMIAASVTTDDVAALLAVHVHGDGGEGLTRARTAGLAPAHGRPADVLAWVDRWAPRVDASTAHGRPASVLRYIDAVTPRLADPSPVPPCPMPAGTVAASRTVDAALASVGGRIGAKDHAASLTPRTRDHSPWSPLAVTPASRKGRKGGPAPTRAAAVLRYIAACERRADAAGRRDARIARLSAPRD